MASPDPAIAEVGAAKNEQLSFLPLVWVYQARVAM